MMNQNIKDEFIDIVIETTPTDELFIKRIFDYADDFEKKFSKDICNWNLQEILEFYRGLNCSSGLTMYNFNSRLKKYTNFCMTKNLVNDLMNHYDEVDEELVFSCVNTAAESRIYVRDELIIDIKNILINPCDKFLVLALYEGLLLKDKESFCKLTEDNINKNKVTVGDRTLTISDDLIHMIKESCNSYDYTGFDVNGEQYVRDFKEEPYVIKRYDNSYAEEADYMRIITNRLVKISKLMGDGYKFTTKSLQNAGRLAAIKQLMNDTGCSFDTAITDKDIIYRYGKIQSIKLFKMRYPNIIGEL